MNPTVPQPPRPQNYYGAAIHQYLGDPIVTINCWCSWHTEGDKTTAREALELHNQTSHPQPHRIYIAGPMTGLPEYNYPAFNAAAADLRSRGHHVENPAENIALLPDWEWRDWMRVGIMQLVLCDTIVLLPGWEQSRGAQLEHTIAQTLDMTVHHYPPTTTTTGDRQ